MIKSCAGTAAFLGKENDKILTFRRGKTKPAELNYNHISVENGEHPKLLFRDDLPKNLKGMAILKQQF